jgi:predicted permease
MMEVLSALAPIVLLIALGKILSTSAFLSDAGWGALDKATYYVFFPCLLFSDLAGATIGAGEALPLAASLITAQCVMALILLVMRPMMTMDGPSFSSIFQGAVRWNSFAALALASDLHGNEGVTLVAIGVSVMVPAANVLSVYVLARHAQARIMSVSLITSMLLRNPLLIACALGLGSHLLPGVPSLLTKVTHIAGAATLPLGLLSVGSGIQLAALRSARLVVLGGSLLKLVAMPVLVALMCLIFGIKGMALEMAILCAAVPAATMSYVLARQMNGNAELMAGIITATTLGAGVTLPLFLTLIRLL